MPAPANGARRSAPHSATSKQYHNEGRALRFETTINDPTDFQSKKALETLPQLRATGARINEQVLAVERVSHACSLSGDAL